jgi:hypothetical protein
MAGGSDIVIATAFVVAMVPIGWGVVWLLSNAPEEVVAWRYIKYTRTYLLFWRSRRMRAQLSAGDVEAFARLRRWLLVALGVVSIPYIYSTLYNLLLRDLLLRLTNVGM